MRNNRTLNLLVSIINAVASYPEHGFTEVDGRDELNSLAAVSNAVRARVDASLDDSQNMASSAYSR